MRRTIWPMTRFFSTVRPGRPSVRTRTSPRLKVLIGPRWLNKARRVRLALKDRLVRKAPPGRPFLKAYSAPSALPARHARRASEVHMVQLARLVRRDRKG